MPETPEGPYPPAVAAERPRVLLLYANPAVTASPVAPYGMECIGNAFRAAGCDVVLEMPWIEADPVAAACGTIAGFLPRLVGISVRNLDDALVVRGTEGAGDIDTTFYLDEVRPLVAAVIALVGRDNVILGGPAVSAGTREVVRYLGARWAIAGPAEDLAWRLGRTLCTSGQAALPADPRIVDADAVAAPDADAPERSGAEKALRRAAFSTWRPVPGPTPRIGAAVTLAMARGGRLAVAIATGCDRRCVFCVEPSYTGGGIRPREVDHVVREVGLLAQAGVRRFWLACSEGNVPGTQHLSAVLAALVDAGLAGPGVPTDFAVFLQPAPVDDRLLDALEGAGIDPTGLSFEFGHLDDRILRAGGGPANRRQLDQLLELWLRRGYRQLGGSVLLGAHPSETEETLASALATAREWDAVLPAGFGLAYACGARVYPGSGLARLLEAQPAKAATHLYARQGDAVDPTWVRPVVYCAPGSPRELLARVRDALAGTRGDMRPMNAEASSDRLALQAEAAVNRGVVRRGQARFAEAAEAFELALEARPTHLEALAQAAQLHANELQNPARARQFLTRLRDALPPSDARHVEVLHALSSLSG